MPDVRRRELIALIGGAAAAWPVVAMAQSADRRPVVGYLVETTKKAHASRIAAFQEGMRDLGYVEGQNIEVAYRFGNFDRAVVPALAEGLLRLNPHVIFAADPIAVLVVKSAAPATPIVCALLIDPIKAGLARSLARPSGRWIDGKAGRIGSGVNATRHHGRRLGRSSEPNPCGSAP
jgi:putative tryptophan/tyrosine transport system substrate-binding protein